MLINVFTYPVTVYILLKVYLAASTPFPIKWINIYTCMHLLICVYVTFCLDLTIYINIIKISKRNFVCKILKLKYWWLNSSSQLFIISCWDAQILYPKEIVFLRMSLSRIILSYIYMLHQLTLIRTNLVVV